MTQEEQNAQLLQEALNGYQMTDENGELTPENENSGEESAPQEETTETEATTAEKSAETEEPTPKVEDTDSENELVEDESGKRYVPQSRFDKIYGKQKALERELEALRKQTQQTQAPDFGNLFPQVSIPEPQIDMSTNTVLEQEILFDKYPQFNPESPQYSRALDALGGTVAKTMPAGTSKLVIAREALRQARELTSNQAEVIAQSRQVKMSQADQGVTSRVAQRGDTSPDPNKMGIDELERFMKETGEWDRF